MALLHESSTAVALSTCVASEAQFVKTRKDLICGLCIKKKQVDYSCEWSICVKPKAYNCVGQNTTCAV